MASFAILLVTLVSLLSTIAYSSSHNHHIDATKLKSLHFTLYLQETINKTAYFIVKGVAGPTGITPTSNPFGSILAYYDPFTETRDPSSKVIGYIEGSCITSSFNGEHTTCPSTTTLSIKGYKGQLHSLGTGQYTKLSEFSFVGGTGDFRFVQGFMIISAVELKSPSSIYKTDFHLYWPPYASFEH